MLILLIAYELINVVEKYRVLRPYNLNVYEIKFTKSFVWRESWL